MLLRSTDLPSPFINPLLKRPGDLRSVLKQLVPPWKKLRLRNPLKPLKYSRKLWKEHDEKSLYCILLSRGMGVWWVVAVVITAKIKSICCLYTCIYITCMPLSCDVVLHVFFSLYFLDCIFRISYKLSSLQYLCCDTTCTFLMCRLQLALQ